MTSIVAVRTPTEIVIGADSKMVSKAHVPSPELVCKIQQAGNLFFVSSGLIGDSASGFSVSAAIRNALSFHVNDTVSRQSLNFIGPFVNSLIDCLHHIIDTNPSLFLIDIEGKLLVSVIIAGFEGEVPLLFRAHFFAPARAPYGDAGVTVFMNSYSANCQYPLVPLYLGNIDAIRRIVNSSEIFWQRFGVENGIRRLIEMEIEGEPATVGPPIDILSITKDGGRWIQRKKECPEIVTI